VAAGTRSPCSNVAHTSLVWRFRALHANFGDIEQHAEMVGTRYDGILLDLGVSTHQIDDDTRGFTFRRAAPLDMRMNRKNGDDAARLLNEADERELERILRDYGDAGARSTRLAREIVRRRRTRAFATSDDLVGAIRAVAGPRSGPSDFAPIFQALRVAVNDELGALARSLPVLRDCLTPLGTMAVISYHSGEDRLVKHAFRDWSAACVCPPRHPVCTCRGRPLGITLTSRAITPSAEETAANPRARSARLRAWRKAA
jgi:16S rRNA (cytosine1402-N4)-methyltransferase